MVSPSPSPYVSVPLTHLTNSTHTHTRRGDMGEGGKQFRDLWLNKMQKYWKCKMPYRGFVSPTKEHRTTFSKTHRSCDSKRQTALPIVVKLLFYIVSYTLYPFSFRFFFSFSSHPKRGFSRRSANAARLLFVVWRRLKSAKNWVIRFSPLISCHIHTHKSMESTTMKTKTMKAVDGSDVRWWPSRVGDTDRREAIAWNSVCVRNGWGMGQYRAKTYVFLSKRNHKNWRNCVRCWWGRWWRRIEMRDVVWVPQMRENRETESQTIN